MHTAEDSPYAVEFAIASSTRSLISRARVELGGLHQNRRVVAAVLECSPRVDRCSLLLAGGHAAGEGSGVHIGTGQRSVAPSASGLPLKTDGICGDRSVRCGTSASSNAAIGIFLPGFTPAAKTHSERSALHTTHRHNSGLLTGGSTPSMPLSATVAGPAFYDAKRMPRSACPSSLRKLSFGDDDRDRPAGGGPPSEQARTRSDLESFIITSRAIEVTCHVPADAARGFKRFDAAVGDRSYLPHRGRLTQVETLRVGCIGAIDANEIRNRVSAVGATLNTRVC